MGNSARKFSAVSLISTFVLLLGLVTARVLVERSQDVREKAQTVNQTASYATLPKPITGTFLMLNFNVGPTVEAWYPYFDDIKDIGMDTVVLLAMGGVECNGTEWNYFNDGTMQRFLQAAYNKQVKAYLGLASADPACVSETTIINQSKSYAQRVKDLNQTYGWGDWGSPSHFIQGFYIGQELPVVQFKVWTERFALFKNLAQEIKTAHPAKLILNSPYKWEDNSYSAIYDNMYYAVVNSRIDIFAIQDSVGTGKVTTFTRDREHFTAAQAAVRDANGAIGKNVKLWANIETFYCPSGCPWDYNPPTDFRRLRWQIRGAEELVSKKITWIHQWSMIAASPTFDGYFPQWKPTRLSLRNEYLYKPIITAVFTWYSPTRLVLKGYNFGLNADQANVYIHYKNASGLLKSYKFSASVQGNGFAEMSYPLADIPEIDISKPYDVAVQNSGGYVSYYVSHNPDTASDPLFSEIPLACTDLIYSSVPSRVSPGQTVQVSCNFGKILNCIKPGDSWQSCTYTGNDGTISNFNCIAPMTPGTYQNFCKTFITSQCPTALSCGAGSFLVPTNTSTPTLTPTNTPTPTPTLVVTSTPTPCIKQGDANGDCRVDGYDYVIWWQNFNRQVTGGSAQGDFNTSGFVDGYDYVIWWMNFGG